MSQPSLYSKYDAGSSYRSYADSAISTNQSDIPNILEVGAHSANSHVSIITDRNEGYHINLDTTTGNQIIPTHNYSKIGTAHYNSNNSRIVVNTFDVTAPNLGDACLLKTGLTPNTWKYFYISEIFVESGVTSYNVACWYGTYYTFSSNYAPSYFSGISGIQELWYGAPTYEPLFLNSISVNARVDDTTTRLNQSSFGNGVEFFDDCDPRVLRVDYPDRVCTAPLASIIVSADSNGLGTIFQPRTAEWGKFASYLQVGDILYNYNIPTEEYIIVEVINNHTVRVNITFTIGTTKFIGCKTLPLFLIWSSAPLIKLGTCHYDSITGKVIIDSGTSDHLLVGDRGCQIRVGVTQSTWKYFSISGINGNELTIFENGIGNVNVSGELWIQSHEYDEAVGHLQERDPANQHESATNPMICAKFNVIRNKTGMPWAIIRDAARFTAKKSDKIGNSYQWDMWRGFGKIDVDAAITYINQTYKTDITKLDDARSHQLKNGLPPTLDYEILYDESPVSKRMIEDNLPKLNNDNIFNSNQIINGTTKTTSLYVSQSKTPTSSTYPGTTGEITWDTNYVYICVSTNTWKRSPLGW